MIYLNDYRVGATVDFKWMTNASAGASITRATDGSIRIYKNNSDVQRTSSAGITDTEDFDGMTGIHHCRIDLSDDTDSGFYASGNEYQVVLQGATIDGQSVNAVLAHFSIERAWRTVSLPGQVAPPASSDLFTMISYLYKAFRNRFTQDATTAKLYADDATTVDQKATVSDNGTTFDRGEFGSGP